MFKKLLFTAFAAFILMSCEVGSTYSATCPTVISTKVITVTGPEETTVNTPVTFEVTYKGKKNCGAFSYFYKNSSVDPLTDIITTNITYDSCNCDEKITNEKTNYTFMKSVPGIYVIKFKDTDDTFVSVTITVS